MEERPARASFIPSSSRSIALLRMRRASFLPSRTSFHASIEACVAMNAIHAQSGTTTRTNRILIMLSDAGGKYDNLSADLHLTVKINGILIDHTDAAGGDVFADGPGLDRTVDAVQRILVPLPQIHCTGA